MSNGYENRPRYKKYSSIKHDILKVVPGILSRNIEQEAARSGNLDVVKKSYDEVLSGGIETGGTFGSKTITVAHDQGLFELHLVEYNLTEEGLRLMHSKLPSITAKFYVEWTFMEEKCSSPQLEVSGFSYKYDMSVLSRVDVDEEFFFVIFDEPVVFQLMGCEENNPEVFIARGELSLKRLFYEPRSKIYETIPFSDIDVNLISSNTSISNCYGNLTVWCAMSGELQNYGSVILKDLSNFRRPSEVRSNGGNQSDDQFLDLTRRDTRFETSSRRSLRSMRSVAVTSSVRSIKPTDSEYASFKGALQLVLNRNKALRTTQSEISNELRDRAKWLHEECNWRRTLQEYAILRGENPSRVRWRQWRDESTAGVRLRSFTSEIKLYEPEAVITVRSLKIYQDTAVMKNDQFQKFYVEYSFLSYEGPEMETPNSLSKAVGRMHFEFKKVFPIDLERQHRDCVLLANAVKSRTPVRFSVVGEPIAEIGKCQSCEEVGVCEVDLFALIQLEENEDTDVYGVKDPKDLDGSDIGELEISFSGLQAMRRAALLVLAPSDYNLIT